MRARVSRVFSRFATEAKIIRRVIRVILSPIGTIVTWIGTSVPVTLAIIRPISRIHIPMSLPSRHVIASILTSIVTTSTWPILIIICWSFRHIYFSWPNDLLFTYFKKCTQFSSTNSFKCPCDLLFDHVTYFSKCTVFIKFIHLTYWPIFASWPIFLNMLNF